MSTYTVLLLYPDYLADDPGETFMGCVQAAGVQEAIKAVQREAYKVNEDDASDPDDFLCLCVIEGDHIDIKDRP